MTDVPDIPLEQIQQRVVAMWMGSFYGSSGYVARKLGKKGLREFQGIGARQVAATFKQLGLDEAGRCGPGHGNQRQEPLRKRGGGYGE